MPHCVIEYSINLNDDSFRVELMQAVYCATHSSELFDSGDIKVRAIPFAYYAAQNKEQGFVHVVLKILSGRTLKQRSLLSGLVLEKLENLSLLQVSLSVEVVEIERASYAKAIK
jgi:5-carboxymethyl-2-hydroxymuconate isomerase